MAKIKIKLNSKRSTTIRAADGAYYKLRAGENIIELEQDAYSALISALGLKPNNKKQKDPKPVAEPAVEPQAVDLPKEQSAIERVEEPAAEQPTVEEQPVCTDAYESCKQIADDVVSESDNTNDDDDTDDDADDQFSQMPYSKLKAAYKEITGKNSKLKRNELINFLREHHNAE
jgi:hypothetical protein